MTNDNNKIVALKDCLKIENDMLTTAKPKMHSARFDTPLALVYDRYILALGGKTSKQHGTKRCEVFDSATNVWQNIAPTPFFCVNSSTVVLKKRHVYMMPGNNRETQANSALLIGYLDTGALERGMDALPSIHWAKLLVRNLDFINACPVAAVPLSENPS